MRQKVTVRLIAEFHNMLPQYQYDTPLEETFTTPELYGRPLTIGHFVNVYQPPALIGGFKTYTYSPYIVVEDNDESAGNNHLIQGQDYQEFFNTLIPMANSTLTRLTLEMEVNDPGRDVDIHSRDLLDRVGFAARHGMAQPNAVDTEKPAMSEYDKTVLYITSGFLQANIIDPLQESRKNAADGIVDADSDRLPDGWEQQIIDALSSDAINSISDVMVLDDFDGDGYCNIREFLSASSPVISENILNCIADIFQDSDVDGHDLSILSGEYDRSDCLPAHPCRSDFDGDGSVDYLDLKFFSEDFGRINCEF